MPFLRKGELLPVKGIDLSLPATYLPDGFHFPQNMQYVRGEWKKADGRTVVGDTSLGAQKILGLASFIISTGSERLIRFTKSDIEKFNTVTQVWDNITGVALSGGEADFFASCVVTESDLLLFTNNRRDSIQKYNDSVPCANLGGSPPKAAYMEYVSPYVVLAFITSGGLDYPWKVQWSDTGQPEIWTGGNSGSALLSHEPSFIRQIKQLREYTMVYKERSLYRGLKVSSSSIFDFGSPFVLGKGLYAPRALASDGINHYYMSLNDFCMNNGVRIIDIGGPVREYIFNRLNRTVNETCHAIHVEQYKEIWFFITVTGYSWPTEVWKYNYEKNLWYFDTVPNCICSVNYKQTIGQTWDSIQGSWDSQVSFWDDQLGVADAPLQYFGYDDALVRKLDTNVVDYSGLAVDAKLETKDYSGLVHKGIEYDSEWMQLDVWARGDKLKAWYSIDRGATWVYINEKDLNANNSEKVTFWFQKISSHIRFRLQADRAGKTAIITSFQPYFMNAGEVWK